MANLRETDDLATLSTLDEDVLLQELKKRYEQDQIYTYVGDILVAINPLKDLGIYGKQHIEQYKMVKRADHPPHIFAISDMAYQSMMGMRGTSPANQCVLISGESGAGKTESTKLIIKQLIELSQGSSELEQQIIQVNPLLEAFGNAQTLMNDNSSRFGRYILLSFQNGQVHCSKISEYLLEKSRVVRQNVGEQNFHVFYYMIAGATPELQERYHLGNPAGYRYLNDGEKCLNEKKDFFKDQYEQLVNGMDIVGFEQHEQDDMFKVLSGVLTLGNIDIKEVDDYASAAKEGALATAAELLGLDVDSLHGCLTCSITFACGDEVRRNFSKMEGEDCRDAIAKAVYGRMFKWIVGKVNQLLKASSFRVGAKIQEIGILDIFGFEQFDHNSFEQACINLANEQLQSFFNKHIFALEQEEYVREGVDWKEIKYVDNAPLLELFLAKPIGLMTLLDDECNIPQATDQTYVDKLNKKFSDNPVYDKSPHARTPTFSIHHYAGRVTYNANGWLEKNRDTIPPDAQEMLRSSENDLLSRIFKAKISVRGSIRMDETVSRRQTQRQALQALQATKERRLTVGTQFKNSLNTLMGQMSQSQPIFIRCIKPNQCKKAGLYEDRFVRQQLLYTGMCETTKIRREGFAVRPLHGEFIQRYQILANKFNLPVNRDSCKLILEKCKLTGWQIGKTKVFLRYHHVDALAEQFHIMGKSVVHMQKIVRGFLGRCHFRKRKEKAAAQAVQARETLAKIEVITATLASSLKELIKEDERIKKERLELEAARRSAIPPAPVPPPIPPTRPVSIEPPNMAAMRMRAPSTVSMSSTDLDDEIEFEPITSKKTRGSMTEFGVYGSREASIRWFRQTQQRKLTEPEEQGLPLWFHGIIKRRHSEELLKKKPVGCFLVRVGESRFGYTLSFRADEKIRHYMIELTRSGKYIVVGEPKVHQSLHDLVYYHKTHMLSNWDGLLGESCGQVEGKCDYSDLVDADYYGIGSQTNGAYMEPTNNNDSYLRNPSKRNTRNKDSILTTAARPPTLPRRNYAKRHPSLHPPQPPPPQTHPQPNQEELQLAYLSLIESQHANRKSGVEYDDDGRKKRFASSRRKMSGNIVVFCSDDLEESVEPPPRPPVPTPRTSRMRQSTKMQNVNTGDGNKELGTSEDEVEKL